MKWATQKRNINNQQIRKEGSCISNFKNAIHSILPMRRAQDRQVVNTHMKIISVLLMIEVYQQDVVYRNYTEPRMY